MFSVIIPYFYLFDKFFEDCINSVLNQTFPILECIVVYSKSEKKYLLSHNLKDKRVVLVESDNLDQSSKRNAGIIASKGQYILFLDCDDCLNTKTLEYSNKILKKYKMIDLISFGYTRDLKQLNLPNDTGFYEEDLDQIKSIIFSEYMSDKYEIDISFDSSCMKVFRKELFIDYDIRFIEGLKCAEDAVLVMTFASHIKNAFFDDHFKSYFWRINPNSTMNDIDSGFLNLDEFTKEMLNVLELQPRKYWNNIDGYLTYIFKKRIQSLIDKYFSNQISYKYFRFLVQKYFLNRGTLFKHLVRSDIESNVIKSIYLCMESNNMKFFKKVVIEKIKYKILLLKRKITA